MKRRSERGLTVIEMLLAVTLLGFVLLGITPLFIASVKSNYSGNEYTSIHMLARDQLEQLMNLPYNDSALSAGTHTATLPGTLPNGAPNPFRLTYEVTSLQIPAAASVPTNQAFVPTPVATGEQYKRIDVTVTSGTGLLGIGTRNARVSGCLSNPLAKAPAPAATPIPATPTP